MGLSKGGSTRQSSGLEPYYERLEPLDGGYEITRADGRPLGRIRVFDDRDEGETGIHVQFTQVGRNRTAVFHFDGAEGYEDLVTAVVAGKLGLG